MSIAKSLAVNAIRVAIFFCLLACWMIFSTPEAKAGEYETFDGRTYNGRFYPRIDIIEWNEEGMASHMEFQNYNKEVPVEMAFQFEEKKGRKVMLVRYTLKRKDGDEVLCRRVVVPAHFGESFHVYKDTADSDREITIVSMVPLPEKKGRKLISSPAKYASCDMPKEEVRMPASEKKTGIQDKVPSNKGALLKKGQDVPFSDW